MVLAAHGKSAIFLCAHHPCLGLASCCPHSDRGAHSAMMDRPDYIRPAGISLLDYLAQRGWRPVRDNGREEVAGLCPLHKDSRPSFYVNRRKQVFYCHGCGRGGGLRKLIGLLEAPPSMPWDRAQLLETVYEFYASRR